MDSPDSISSDGLAVSGTVLHAPARADIAGIWSPPGIGTIILWSEGTQSLIRSDFKGFDSKKMLLGDSNTKFVRTIAPPQPSLYAVALLEGVLAKSSLALFHGSDLVRVASTSELLQQCVRLGAPRHSEFDLEHAVATERWLCLPLTDKSTNRATIAGFAQLDLSDLTVLSAAALRISSRMNAYSHSWNSPLIDPISGDREIAFIQRGEQLACILVTVVRHPQMNRFVQGRGIRWEAWELRTYDDPIFICGNTFLCEYYNEHLSPQRVSQFDITPRLPTGAITVVSPNEILINVDDDSVYLANIQERTTSIVFHPGSEQIHVKVSAGGTPALYMRPGFRVFVLENRN